MSTVSPQEILLFLRNQLQLKGMEVYLMKAGWYNDFDSQKPRNPIHYPNNTLCALILITPSFFNSTFIEYLRENFKSDQGPPANPVESCADHFITPAVDALNVQHKILTDKIIKTDSGKNLPEVDLRIAGHVSGATYYYQRKDVLFKFWWPGCDISGVCIHPKYGGWFDFRSVVVFENIQDESMEPVQPIDCVPGIEDRVKLLNLANFPSSFGTYRNIISAEEEYSEKIKQYRGYYFAEGADEIPALEWLIAEGN